MGGLRALAVALAWVTPALAQGPAVEAMAVSRVRLAGRPYGAAISPAGVAYITLVQAARLGRITLPATTVAPAVPVGSLPTEVAFNSTGTRAYVTNQFSQNVGVVSVATNAQVDVIPVQGNPFEVIVAPGDTFLYVTTNVDRVFGIRLATKEVATSFRVPRTANGLAVTDTLLYASTWRGGTVVEFNLRTRMVTRTFAVGGIPQKLAFSACRDTLYIANEAGYVQFWDLVLGTQIGRNLTLPGGGGFGIARNPADGLVYVSTAYIGGGRIHVVDPRTRTVLRTIHAGGSSRRVVFDATGAVGFVPNEAGWVDVLRPVPDEATRRPPGAFVAGPCTAIARAHARNPRQDSLPTGPSARRNYTR